MSLRTPGPFVAGGFVVWGVDRRTGEDLSDRVVSAAEELLGIAEELEGNSGQTRSH